MAARRSAPKFTDAQIRNILLEHRYLAKVDAICKKWKITKEQLRQWKKEHNFEYLRASMPELLIVALQSGPVRDASSLVTFLDWQDHAVYPPHEIVDALDQLVASGRVIKKRGSWHYDESRLKKEGFVF